jgi:hypothetical protein
MRFVAALLYAASSAVLAALVLAFAAGGLDSTSAGVSLLSGACVFVGVLWSERQHPWPSQPVTGWAWAPVIIFVLFSLRAFLWLVFRDDGSIKVLSPNNLGDLALHLTYIEHIASGAAFWPQNPIYSGGSLTYPIGVDLINSLLLLVGLDVLRGLIWVGLIGCLCTGIALWRWGGGFALAGFLFNGGLFGFAYFGTGQIADYQSDMAWKSIPLALFITQRGFLFALPAGLLLLTSWRARLFQGGASPRTLPRWGEILLYTTMPIFHLHTFLFLSLLLGIWFVLYPAARRHLALLVGVAFLPATVLVLLVTGMLRGASMLGWKIGWMQSDPAFLQFLEENLGALPSIVSMPLFWILNFGILPLLVGWLCLLLARKMSAVTEAAFVFPAVGTFLVCCFVKFAPWEWDNTKLMIWSYLTVLPFLWSEIISRWTLPLRAAACAALFTSGFISLIGGLDSRQTGHEIAIRRDLDQVRKAVAGMPIADRFIGWPTYNHPLLLVGRPMALGYPGHVWSHGLVLEQPLALVTSVMNGAPGWREHAASLQARYLFWGAEERENYPESTQPWSGSAALIASGEWGEIYDLTEPATAEPTTP